MTDRERVTGAATAYIAVVSSVDNGIGTTAQPAVPVETPDGEVGATPPTTQVLPCRLTVPDGVGLNYQAAQDRWGKAGLHVAPAVDGTGAHRLPVIDSDWVVLVQDLAADSTVRADSFITATVKKLTDGWVGDVVSLRSR